MGNRRKDLFGDNDVYLQQRDNENPYKYLPPSVGRLFTRIDECEELSSDPRFIKNRELLESKGISVEGIDENILKTRDLEPDYFTLYEGGIPEEWMRKKPQIFNRDGKTKLLDFEILKLNFGLDDEDTFEFIDEAISSKGNVEMRERLYERVGIDLELHGKGGATNEYILTRLPVGTVSERFKELKDYVTLPVKSDLITYNGTTQKSIDLLKENGIEPPYEALILHKSPGQLELDIESLKQYDVDLTKFRQLLTLGITKSTLLGSLFDEYAPIDTFHNVEEVMFALRNYAKSVGYEEEFSEV